MRYLSAIILCMSLLGGVTGCGGGGGGGASASAEAQAPGPAPTQEAVPSAGTDTNGGGTAAAGVANLAWDASSGGNPAVAGYKVSYGPSSGAYAKTIDVGNSTSCSIRDLAQGTYYFAVSAYDSSGTESGYSNEVSKTIR